MRLYYVTREPSTGKDGTESVSVKIRKASDHQDDIGVVVQWTRTAKTDWTGPQMAVVAPLDMHQKCAMFLYRFSQYISKLKIADIEILMDPDSFLFRLEKEGNAKQAVYDPRHGKMMPVDELEAGVLQWMGDVEDGRQFPVLAETEDEARKKVTKLVQAEMSEKPDHAGRLSYWFTNGLKVHQKKSKGEKPTYVSTKVYCKRNSKAARDVEAERETVKPTEEKKAEG